jgi:hypothetical protein
MPDLNGILKQARGAANQAARLGTRTISAGFDVARGVLGRGESDDTRVAATAAPAPVKTARKPPTRPPSRAKKAATPRRSPSPRTTKPPTAVTGESTRSSSSPAEPAPTDLAAARAGRQPAPLGSTTEPGTGSSGAPTGVTRSDNGSES